MQTLLSNLNIKATTIEITKVGSIRPHLDDAIYRHDSFVLMLHHCTPLKAIKYKSTSFTADVRQPWTNLHECYFEYLIIRFDYLIIPFDYLIIG